MLARFVGAGAAAARTKRVGRLGSAFDRKGVSVIFLPLILALYAFALASVSRTFFVSFVDVKRSMSLLELGALTRRCK